MGEIWFEHVSYPFTPVWKGLILSLGDDSCRDEGEKYMEYKMVMCQNKNNKDAPVVLAFPNTCTDSFPVPFCYLVISNI